MTESTALDAATKSAVKRTDPPQIVLEADVVAVVVHARGAVVTRRVEVSDDAPTGPFELVCRGITATAETNGIRCEVVRGERLVASVRTRLDVPEHDTGPGPSRERVEELDRQLRRLDDEHAAIVGRMGTHGGVQIAPRTGRSLAEEGAESRVKSALAAVELVDDRIAAMNHRLAEIEREHRSLSRQRESAIIEDSQTSKASRDGLGVPSRAVVLTVGAGEGGGVFTFSYVVPQARWWPIYTLRIDDDGRSASLLVEAHVAQASGEDWDSVQIGFATSEIVSDAQLPKLPAYRLGRAQPEPRSGFRPPPEGVERLFASFDLAFQGAGVEAPSHSIGQAAQFGSAAQHPSDAPRSRDMDDTGDFTGADMAFLEQDSFAAPSTARSSMRKRATTPARPPAAARVGAARGSSPPPPGGGGGRPEPTRSVEQGAVEPSDEWLRFDDVTLAPLTSSDRGKLRRERPDRVPSGGSVGSAVDRAERMGSVDPWVSRGNYDHRYDAVAAVDVPSDGALHRVEIVTAACPSSLAWRTNPREDSSVYREVTLDNPHPSPLLAGPLDVYVRGSLVANTAIDTIGRGGTMTVGLGVDERFRVARNARIREESAGLLGGKREIDHFVDIEIASSLGFDAMVEVIDRIPVSRDEHVEVELFESVPQGEDYDQTDRDQPVEGGRRWRVDVLAGDQATVRFAYRVKLRSKDELVGGNRRE